MADWAKEITGWRRQVSDLLFRNWKQVELLPDSTWRTSTAGLSLTTNSTGSTVPSLELTLPVPMGAIIHASAVLDIDTTNAIGIGELYVSRPSSPAFAILSGSSAAIVFGTTNAGHQRATVTQQWGIANPEPGAWSFQIRARKLPADALPAGSGGVLAGAHDTLRVVLL
jgi:hypothetical protein